MAGPHKQTMEHLLDIQHNQFSLFTRNETNSTHGRYNENFNILEFLAQKVVINETAARYFVEDFSNLQMQYEALKRQKENERRELVQDKYAETVSKLYLNFAKNVYPAVDNFAKVLKTASPSKNCDQKCLIDACLMPRNYDTKCYAKCKCTYDAKKLEKESQAFDKSVEKIADTTEAYIQKAAKDFEKQDKIFKQRQEQQTLKFYEFVKRQAISAVGCDAQCVNKCTNPKVYNLEQVGECLEQCECNGGIIKLAEGTYEIKPAQMNKLDSQSLAYIRDNHHQVKRQ